MPLARYGGDREAEDTGPDGGDLPLQRVGHRLLGSGGRLVRGGRLGQPGAVQLAVPGQRQGLQGQQMGGDGGGGDTGGDQVAQVLPPAGGGVGAEDDVADEFGAAVRGRCGRRRRPGAPPGARRARRPPPRAAPARRAV
ncbi:hypothetical protein CF54_16545 [Streptomyces sp. Tu 6176]|nr:hypothetical protein CF54_16545 [Streptomyces sp. Tu 6176]